MFQVLSLVAPALAGISFLYKYANEIAKIEQLRQTYYAKCMIDKNNPKVCIEEAKKKYPFPQDNPIVVGSVVFVLVVFSWYVAEVLRESSNVNRNIGISNKA